MSLAHRRDDDAPPTDPAALDRASELADLPWSRDSGLEIRGGGAVAVDTETLRSTAASFVSAKVDLEDIGMRLSLPHSTLIPLWDHARDAVSSLTVLIQRVIAAQTEADRVAAALREAAIAYELVELDAEHRVAAAAGDTTRASWIDERIAHLREKYPDAWSMAVGARFGRALEWPGELTRQGTEGGLAVGSEFGGPAGIVVGTTMGLGTIAAAAGVGLSGAGRLARDSRLEGAAGAVTVTSVAPAPASGAPRSLADATARLPGAGDSRVRVEGYTMADGTKQYALYIAGTQSLSYGGDDPWDVKANHQLYTGQQSESYAATKQALAAAGVESGDTVHMFAFSQGGMVASHLALEGEYRVETLVALGNPVSADVGDDTLSVSVRHTDDAVAALAAGGHHGAVGAPGSMVIERVSHPDADLGDLAAPAHHLSSYAETAALIDASDDPRVGNLRSVFDQLGQAVSVEVSEYTATRG